MGNTYFALERAKTILFQVIKFACTIQPSNKKLKHYINKEDVSISNFEYANVNIVTLF